MKNLKYPLTGAIVGLVLGVFFGFIFDSFYTKKSELENKQRIQVILFGSIGVVGGLIIGSKVAAEEQENINKEIEYNNSIVTKNCLWCKSIFEYSKLEYSNKNYCNTCIRVISKDYIIKIQEIQKLLIGINELKRNSAILKRLEKMNTIANELMIYENVDLEMISKKPSEILEMVGEYQKLVN
ncbi:hypothetical protein [uncultured Dokdonia sp.]|uniref:hypothetical protein n=1 Tax=uncultured Dokdonia sp. TaxID=575653 RepID=UPI0026139F51|nr:hypothetical protein [uncultured Dokdonia sp.]